MSDTTYHTLLNQITAQSYHLSGERNGKPLTDAEIKAENIALALCVNRLTGVVAALLAQHGDQKARPVPAMGPIYIPGYGMHK